MPKSSKKGSSQESWNGPTWHETYQQYYMERAGQDGRTEYRWIGSTLSTGDNTSPRSQQVDELTQSVQDMNLSNAGYSGSQQYLYPDQQGLQSSGSNYPSQPYAPTGTHGASSDLASSSIYAQHGAAFSQGKGKGKARVEDEKPTSTSNPNLPQLQGDPQPVDPGYGLSGGDYPTQEFEPSSGNFSSATSGSAPYPSSYQVPFGNVGNATQDDESEDDLAFQRALEESRRQHYAQSRPGESSTYGNAAGYGQAGTQSTVYEQGNVGPTPYGQANTQPAPFGQHVGSATYGQGGTNAPIYGRATVDPSTYHHVEDEEDEGILTPRGMSPTRLAGNRITSTSGNTGLQDPRFVVEHSHRYQPGEVLKIYWSEPRGAARAPPPADVSEWEVQPTDQGPFYVGYRRFIVVRTDEGNSTCIPISTYEGKACKKKGVRAAKHGIVYELSKHGKTPRLLKGEPPLGYDPVALEIYAPTEKLAPESRVNYSKLTTIEHNVKVFFIGRVAQQHLQYVQYCVNDCWSKKITERTPRKSRR